MNTPSKQHDSWESCDAGYLVGISARAKSARRKQTALRTGAGLLAFLSVVGLGIWSTGYFLQPQENYFGGIACHELQGNMPGYMAGTLPGEVSARIDIHLQQCPICREIMQKMQEKQAATVGQHDYWSCECPECQRHLVQTATRVFRLAEGEEERFLVYASGTVHRGDSESFSSTVWGRN